MAEFVDQPSFSSGEISPALYGRVDQELYYAGLKTCLNTFVKKFGGVSNRPGTIFTAETQDSSKKTRLIPFTFNEEQTYMLEFGNTTMRVIRNGAEVVETDQTITAITQANPAVVTVASHPFSDGDDVFIKDVVGMVEVNTRTFRVANKTANDFELTDFAGNNIDSTNFVAYTSAGVASKVFTLATPYLEEDLFDLNFVQKNDVLTIVHGDYYPRDITRTDHDAWTIVNFPNTEGPFIDENVTATTVQASATTGAGVTLTASSGIFTAAMVGDLFYIEQEPDDTTDKWEAATARSANDIRRSESNFYEAQNTATTGVYRPSHIEGTEQDGDGGVEWEYLHSGFGIVEITAFSSDTSVTAEVKRTLPDLVVSAPTTIWAKAAWSDEEGYPQSVTYHKQRLWFAGTPNQPNGLWISGAGLRFFFGKENPILDSDALTLRLDTSDSVSAARHLVPMKSLIALTDSNEVNITGVDGLILATDIPSANPESYQGASKVKPLKIGTTVLFVQDLGAEIRSLQFNVDTGIGGGDLSVRSQHLFKRSSVVDWAYQKHPLSVIWLTMSDGTRNGLTFLPEQEVFGWHRHETDGDYESVATIREGDETAEYAVIKRTINGNIVRYVERSANRVFNKEIPGTQADRLGVRNAHFVDSGLTFDGRNTSSTTITISNGTTWDLPETLTVTASSSIFKSSDVGDQIIFYYENDTVNGIVDISVRIDITGFTSATEVTGIPTKTVPVEFRNTAFTAWEFGRDEFFPLDHLEGKTVAVLADGNVVEPQVVTDGKITIPTPSAVVHVGLPYVSDIRTLNIAKGARINRNKKSAAISRVFLEVEESRTVFVGTNGFNDLREIRQRTVSMGYDAPIPAETKVFEVNVDALWTNTGDIAIRQSDPLPITVNNIIAVVDDGHS